MPNSHSIEEKWQKVRVAARREGRVVVYTNTVEVLNDRIKADFESAFPDIELECIRIVGTPLVSRMEDEGNKGCDGADVAVTVEIPWLAQRAREGRLLPVEGPDSIGWPADYLLHQTVPILGIDPFVLVYNPDLVPDPISSYRDLLRTEFRGRFAAPLLTSVAEFAWYDWLDRTLGNDFLHLLSQQNPVKFANARPASEAVAAGEVVASALSVPAIAMQLERSGAAIRMVIPDPCMGFSWGGGVVGWCRRPNAARVFLNYLMSRRAQSVWCGGGLSASPLNSVLGSLDASSLTVYSPEKYDDFRRSAIAQKLDRSFSPS